MKILSMLAVGMLAFLPIVTSSCISTGDGQSLASLEEMTDVEFSRLQLFVSLGVRVGANRLVTEGVVDPLILNVVADVVEEVATSTSIVGSVSEVLAARLVGLGLTADEIQLLFLLAEQAIAERGGFTFIDVDGQSLLSERSQSILLTIAAALRQPLVTAFEFDEAQRLGADFSFEVFQNYDVTFEDGRRVSCVTTVTIDGVLQPVYALESYDTQ